MSQEVYSGAVSDVELFFNPAERLRMTAGDRSWHTVKPAWAAPLSRPGQYLCLLNAKGEEILTVVDPSELPEASRVAVEEELRRRYLSSTVERIVSVKPEFGATYWIVETERGTRDFVTQSLQENAQWLSDSHLLLIDVDGNRFEIPDVAALDKRSQEFIEAIL